MNVVKQAVRHRHPVVDYPIRLVSVINVPLASRTRTLRCDRESAVKAETEEAGFSDNFSNSGYK